MVEHAQLEAGGLDAMRENIASLYSSKYRRLSELYGGSNDNADAADGTELDPTGAAREPLPYLPPTEQTETGYVGLEPPVG